MNCPFCGYSESKVVDSRPTDEKKRRRRECNKCQKRFTTYEVIESPLILVEKRDKTFEEFDRHKLISGVLTALKKRPVKPEQVSYIADYVVNQCENEMRNTITSAEIGDLVLECLKKIDAVAYIRFASVYKDFTDLKSFIAEISELDK